MITIIVVNIIMTIYWGFRAVKSTKEVMKTYNLMTILTVTLIFETPTFIISSLVYYLMEMIL